MAWQEAREHCQEVSPNIGGDLASIPDEDTNEFLQSLTPTKEADVWVGGHRSSGNGEEWTWSDGTSWQYNNWFEGQPDNLGGVQTHLSFNFDHSGHWDDDFAFDEKSFICSHKGKQATLSKHRYFTVFLQLVSPGGDLSMVTVTSLFLRRNPGKPLKATANPLHPQTIQPT